MAVLLVSTFCSTQCGTSSSYCESHETCCPLSNGGYSCCAYINGVCCSGEVRCCPSNRFCFGGSCISEESYEDNYLATAAAMMMTPSFEKLFLRFNFRKSE